MSETAVVIEVIQVRFNRGLGRPDDPVREVTRYHAPSGVLLAELDPKVGIVKQLAEDEARRSATRMVTRPLKAKLVPINMGIGEHELDALDSCRASTESRPSWIRSAICRRLEREGVRIVDPPPEREPAVAAA